MKRLLLVAAALLAAAPAFPQAFVAHTAARAGRYEDALAAFRRGASAAADDADLRRAWVRTLLEIGRHAEAERVAGEFPGEASAMATVLGEALAAQGRLEEAEQAFTTAIDAGASDALVARARRGVLLQRTGRGELAEADFDALIDAYNQRQGLTSDELVAVGIACQRLGPTNPQLYRDALKAWDEAVAAEPGNLDARVRLAELFLDKYNGPSAREAIQTVLAVNPNHPRGQLALARMMDFEGERGGMDLVRKALETNPAFAEARAWLGEALLTLERYDEAEQEATRALEDDPSSLEAMAVLAGSHFLQGDEAAFAEVRERALTLNPQAADFFNTLADLSWQNRLYREAADFASEAVELDPRSWRGHGLLGTNLLRLGRIEEGRRSLERAFEGDPFHVWNKNTLDLLDTFDRYVTTRSPRFRFFVDRNEAGALTPYLSELAEEALSDLSARFRFTPQTPIRVEVYPSHADFSVRTVGLAGLGALGVCFGTVVAIDSPSARERGSFNWGSTLWHELAHVITLGISEHRVPRWLTEGISVREEWRARPGWGDDPGLPFLASFKRGDLLPVGSLNDGFVRPDGPQQVGISYMQAGLVVEWIEREKGFDAVLALLEGYRTRSDPEATFRAAVGMSYEEFDAVFFEDLRRRHAGSLDAIRLREGPPQRVSNLSELVAAAEGESGDFVAQLAAGKALLEAREKERARVFLERARELMPEYAEPDSPHWLLGRLALDEGDHATARRLLEDQIALNENHWEARLALADAAEGLGDTAAAAEALEGAITIDAFDPGLHVRLAGLYAQLGRHERVVRERRVIVALDPVDRAEALYQLALALRDAGRTAEAKAEVLGALELAPRFQRAQELLLELHRAGRTGGGGE